MPSAQHWQQRFTSGKTLDLEIWVELTEVIKTIYMQTILCIYLYLYIYIVNGLNPV